MKGKEVRIYRGNGTKDKGHFRSKQLTIKNVPCIPTTFMTLCYPVNQSASPKVKDRLSLHGSVLT